MNTYFKKCIKVCVLVPGEALACPMGSSDLRPRNHCGRTEEAAQPRDELWMWPNNLDETMVKLS